MTLNMIMTERHHAINRRHHVISHAFIIPIVILIENRPQNQMYMHMNKIDKVVFQNNSRNIITMTV